ncbi:hypothetical protein ABZ806_06800, partial [Spirillospora sp. NPDC047418]
PICARAGACPGAAAEKGRGERESGRRAAAPAAGTAGARPEAPPSWVGRMTAAGAAREKVS